MKNKINIFPLIMFLLSMFFLTSCERETKRPLPMGIPDKDIVFVPEKYPSTNINADINTLGFINADGTEREEYSFTFAGGAKSMFGKTIFTRYANYPRWSPSGDKLVFGIRNTAPNMRLIDAQGHMYGKKCIDINGSVNFDNKDFIIKVLHKHDLIFDQYKDLIDENHIPLIHYDLINCNVVSISYLYVPSIRVYGVGDEASNGLIVVNYYDESIKDENFLIYDTKNEKHLFSFDTFTLLNKDGTLVIYVSPTETMIVRNLETNVEQEIIEISSNAPLNRHDISGLGWSPDSKWLIYSTTEGEIYKINIETGENTYITHGWYPDWR